MCYSQDTPGCLVLDIHLRGMSGIDLLEKLATENVVIPIVLITAIDEAPSGEELRRPGVTCLQKPFDEALLIQAIDTATGGSPAATGD